MKQPSLRLKQLKSVQVVPKNNFKITNLFLQCDIRKSRESPAVVVGTFENKQKLFVLGACRDAGTSVESCELL